MLEKKLADLKYAIKSMESVLIAFSGGVDSTFLSRVAFDVLKDRALAVTATSATYPRSEFLEAKELAREIGIKKVIMKPVNGRDLANAIKKALKENVESQNIRGKSIEGKEEG